MSHVQPHPRSHRAVAAHRVARGAWRDRVKVLADASGVSAEGLGELVEAELTRLDGVLFTATPASEIDEISSWARLSDAAWCGQVRAIDATHNRMPATHREFLACEVATALLTASPWPHGATDPSNLASH